MYMNLIDLQKAVDAAVERAKRYQMPPEEVVVSLQIDGPGEESVHSRDFVELIYDNDCQASGCVLIAYRGFEQ